MAETAENVAAEWEISREDQDAFALRSQQRAVPLGRARRRDRSGLRSQGLLAQDEHPRPGTTIEALAKLKPIVRPNGTVTAGNASGINDGACAILLASEQAATRHGLTPMARVVASAVAGVAPRVMGIGPVPASRKALTLAGLRHPANGRDRVERSLRRAGTRGAS